MSFKLTILGFHSATPRLNAHPSAQVLELKNQVFLIDCGEGTQIQLRKHRIGFGKINHIFISHLHGDHFFGLVGLISSFGLLSRKKTLHIYAPVGLKEIIELQLKISETQLSFPLEFHELKNLESELILDDINIEVHTIPLKHRIYTNGFLFKEKIVLRNLNIENITQYPDIQRCDYLNLKKGNDFVTATGTVIPNKLLTHQPKKTFSYAYCSDTLYHPNIIPLIQATDVLYHEATFCETHLELAITTGHATAKHAAKIAKKAKVGKLILGHFSSRYNDYFQHLAEAKQVFDNSILAEEGLVIDFLNCDLTTKPVDQI